MAFVVVILVGLFAARACQRGQVRISQAQAVSVAVRQVTFRPTRTQVRLVRQGLGARPFWAVSLSVPSGGSFSRLAVVRVDANTGAVRSVQRDEGGG